MRLNEYQKLAARTINENLSVEEKIAHALHGMVGEIGEVHSIYQKELQGHSVSKEELMGELGDLEWFISEYCTAMGWTLEEVCQYNIEKLMRRYPDGFEEYRSIHREE